MAFFTTWFSKGKQVFSRVVEKISSTTRRFTEHVTGRRFSDAQAKPQPPASRDLQKEGFGGTLASEGEVQTPWGNISIDPQQQKASISGNVPASWIAEMDWQKPQIVTTPNMWGKPFHYKVQFKVLIPDTDGQGRTMPRIEDKWVTVVSKSEISQEDVISRASEVALDEYSRESPSVRGVVAGLQTIAPVFYSGSSDSLSVTPTN